MSDTPAVPPAMSSEEWAGVLPEPDVAHQDDDMWAFNAASVQEMRMRPQVGLDDRRHAQAAVCLFGQPYGFTREDVAALEQVESWLEATWDNDVMRRYAGVIAKIAALLPPHEVTP